MEGSGVRRQNGVHWWRICRSTRSPTRGRVTIRFGIYNICNGRNGRNGRIGGLESALRGMSQASMDLVIFQETKVTDIIYTCRSAGYSVVALDVPS